MSAFSPYLKIGLEVETLLTGRKPRPAHESLNKFTERLAMDFNKLAIHERVLYQMHADIDQNWAGTDYVEWSLTSDCTITGGSAYGPNCMFSPSTISLPRNAGCTICMFSSLIAVFGIPVLKNQQFPFFQRRAYGSPSKPRILNFKEATYLLSSTNWHVTDPIEIVSPIMRLDKLNSWRRTVHYMFKFMDKLCYFETNTSCGTHIHISPNSAQWTTAELRSIAKAIIHFETALEVLVPTTRRGSQWCRSNRYDNPAFTKVANNGGTGMMTSQDIFKTIDACNDAVEVAKLMSPERYFAWNFANIFAANGKGTIEFRRPPGLVDIDTCCAWIEFTVAFVQAARMQRDDRNFALYTRDVSGLRQFLYTGLIQGMSKRESVERVLAGHHGSLQPKTVGHVDEALMKKKMKIDGRKNLMLKKVLQELGVY